jgi:3-deoxy-manno-octulosonate cytidylyltransferase (CMP-KDO synthetase)
MANGVRVAAIIPARMASSRFPGKPLLKVRDLPMVEHVRRRALRCKLFSEVVVATCDREIAEVVEGYGGRCVMTSSAHPAATDRVAEAARSLDCTHVVNVQGDEILVLAEDLEKMVRAIEKEPEVPVWNAVAPITEAADLADRSVVKAVVSASGRILYCARDFSGLVGKIGERFEPIRRILGILGYSREFLERYSALPRTPLEVAEGIDESRVIEHDVLLRGVEFSKGYPGINEPSEIDLVEQCLQENSAQQALLREILR